MLITRPFVYSESLQHPTIAILLIKVLIFFDHSVVHLFQSNQRFHATEYRGPTRFGKALNLIFPKLSLKNIRGLRKDAWHNDLRLRPTIPGRGILTEKLGGGVQHASCNPYPISDQNL